MEPESMRRYRDTKPYRITAKYAFTCSTCKQLPSAKLRRRPGSKALYFQQSKSLECTAQRS
jgi:hypothetical protein